MRHSAARLALAAVLGLGSVACGLDEAADTGTTTEPEDAGDGDGGS